MLGSPFKLSFKDDENKEIDPELLKALVMAKNIQTPALNSETVSQYNNQKKSEDYIQNIINAAKSSVLQAPEAPKTIGIKDVIGDVLNVLNPMSKSTNPNEPNDFLGKLGKTGGNLFDYLLSGEGLTAMGALSGGKNTQAGQVLGAIGSNTLEQEKGRQSAYNDYKKLQNDNLMQLGTDLAKAKGISEYTSKVSQQIIPMFDKNTGETIYVKVNKLNDGKESVTDLMGNPIDTTSLTGVGKSIKPVTMYDNTTKKPILLTFNNGKYYKDGKEVDTSNMSPAGSFKWVKDQNGKDVVFNSATNMYEYPGTQEPGEPSPSAKNYGQKLIQSIESDDTYKKAKAGLSKLAMIEQILQLNNPLTQEVLKKQLPRLLEEVGNMALAEQAIGEGSKTLLDKLKQGIQNLATGGYTPENIKYLRDTVSVLSKNMENNGAFAVDNQTESYKKLVADDDLLKTISDAKRKLKYTSYSQSQPKKDTKLTKKDIPKVEL
jgi:hypothetical protein